MPATLPAAANPTTLSGAFFNFMLNGEIIASGLTETHGMQYGGDWVQPFGTQNPLRDPNMRSGRGTIERANIYGNRISDILLKTKVITQQQLNQDGLDLRFTPMTAMARYSDGTKTITKTLNEVYITETSDRIEGNRLQRVTISFEYSFETEQ